MAKPVIYMQMKWLNILAATPEQQTAFMQAAANWINDGGEVTWLQSSCAATMAGNGAPVTVLTCIMTRRV